MKDNAINPSAPVVRSITLEDQVFTVFTKDTIKDAPRDTLVFVEPDAIVTNTILLARPTDGDQVTRYTITARDNDSPDEDGNKRPGHGLAVLAFNKPLGVASITKGPHSGEFDLYSGKHRFTMITRMISQGADQSAYWREYNAVPVIITDMTWNQALERASLENRASEHGQAWTTDQLPYAVALYIESGHELTAGDLGRIWRVPSDQAKDDLLAQAMVILKSRSKGITQETLQKIPRSNMVPIARMFQAQDPTTNAGKAATKRPTDADIVNVVKWAANEVDGRMHTLAEVRGTVNDKLGIKPTTQSAASTARTTLNAIRRVNGDPAIKADQAGTVDSIRKQTRDAAFNAVTKILTDAGIEVADFLAREPYVSVIRDMFQKMITDDAPGDTIENAA